RQAGTGRHGGSYESRIHRSRQHGTADRSARVASRPHGSRLQPHAQPRGCAQTAPTHNRRQPGCGGAGRGRARHHGARRGGASGSPLLDAMGQGVIVAGDDPGRANVIKLAGNFLLAAVIEAMGEAFALVRKYDVAPADLLEIVNGRLFRSPIYENYGTLIAEERYQPAGLKLRYGPKYVRLVLGAADGGAAPMAPA